MKIFNIFRKKEISKEEARQEIEELRRIYRSKFPMSRCGFMVGSCEVSKITEIPMPINNEKKEDCGNYLRAENSINCYICGVNFFDHSTKGDGDFALKSRTDTTFDGTKEWFAGILDKGHASGSTPEEAVANLWLALNKK